MSTNSRFYFLLPDEKTATRITEELRAADIKDENIHVIAGIEGKVPSHLPEATLLQESDVTASAVKGAAAGAGTGLFAGLAAVMLGPGIIAAGGLALVGAGTVGGAAIGAWISSMIGVSVPNKNVQPFLDALDEGKLLMLVDYDSETRAERINQAILRHYPDAKMQTGTVS